MKLKHLTLLMYLSALNINAASTQLKIISLAPHTTELAFDAGLGDNVIAVSAYSDYPAKAKELEQVANYRSINIERIITLKPDLILAWQGGNPENVLNKLKAFGIKIFYSSPNSLYDIADDIEKLGQYAPDPNIAKQHAKRLREKTKELERKYENKKKVSYFYQLSSNPMMTNSGEHWPQSIFSLCGGTNIFADSPAPYPHINLEQIIVRKPEAIFSLNGVTSPSDWQKWQNYIPAVKNNAIFFIKGDNLNRPASRALQAAEQICEFFEQVRKLQKF